MKPRIYLAGPDVFLANAEEVGRRKQELCRQYGFEGLFPLDLDQTHSGDAMAIFRANCVRMRQAKIGLFNLTPFRGPSADAGTVFELGFMAARGKRVYGYASVSLEYAERVEAEWGPLVAREGGRWDRDGYAVEEFGLSDNLMIVEAIREAGGRITVVEENAGTAGPGGKTGDRDAALAAFAAFEACLRAVAEDMG
jgi:nucleoside 2-deoxyribosyltransferase